MLYACSRSDLARLGAVRRFTGRVYHGEGGAELLALTDRIWRTNTVPSRFVTDSMVAAWLGDAGLAATMPDLLSAEDQYKLLAWYCCARPRDTGCLVSREPVDAILERMAREPVAPSPEARLPYSALMLAIYHFRPDLHAAVSLAGESDRPSFLGWYYTHGLCELGILHHVSRDERAALNAIRDGEDEAGASPLCRFALEWLPHPDFDLASPHGRAAAQAWFVDALGGMEPFASLAEASVAAADEAPAAAPPAGDANVIAAHFGDRVRPIEPRSAYRLDRRVCEYFDRRGGGARLLLTREWHPAEATFCWSRAPWASLVFELAGPVDEGVTLGLLLHASDEGALLPDRRLTIYLNGMALWQGTHAEATTGELVLRVSGSEIRTGGPNLLQFHVSETLVPARLDGGPDTRQLGIPLRRFWVDDNREAGAGRTTTRPLPNPAQSPAMARVAEQQLLVLRGDLRSHTGYAKAIRALAALIPDKFQVVGVDIHPDPSDNEAAVAFPVVPEAEALQQVAQHPRRCAVLHCTSPDEFAVWPNARNVGWFFWETEAIPHLRQWPFKLSLMDAVWAPSGFMRDFVRSTGYGGPVPVVAWPDDFAVAEPGDRADRVIAHYFAAAEHRPHPVPLGELRREARLVFLAVQSLSARKGLPLLLSEWRQYLERAQTRDTLVLRLAFRHAAGLQPEWRDVFDEALAAAGFRRGTPARIALIPQAVSESELGGLYRTADAYLSMSYGEGFGGPVVEALRNFCPVIAPRHTGLCDLIPEDYPMAVASTRLAVGLKGNLPAYPHSATWHVPNPGELQQKLATFAMLTAAARRDLLQYCRKHAMSFCWAPVVRQRLGAALDALDLDGEARGRPAARGTGARPSLAGRHAAD